uniref:SCP domain-containing protein n=1 Tax=Oryzias latipes TaxID=8090 RepID=A0A3P9MCB6_ORYLA
VVGAQEPFMDHKRVSKCICLYLPQKWNTEAEANAQKWANTCSMTHSPATSGCGENLYMSRFKNSWTNVLQGPKSQFFKIELLWSSKEKLSDYIGCPMAYCPNSTYKYFYVCHYCPPGNYQLSRPYKSGPSCADCPSACENKLCCKSRTQECTIKNELHSSSGTAQTPRCGIFCVPACCRCTNQILQTANHSLTQIQ